METVPFESRYFMEEAPGIRYLGDRQLLEVDRKVNDWREVVLVSEVVKIYSGC